MADLPEITTREITVQDDESPQPRFVRRFSLLDVQGCPTAEVRLGDPLTVRVLYHCPEPVPRPTILVAAVAHQGPCALALRSRKAPDWRVEELRGEGHIDVAIPRLELNPGPYAVSAHISDERDLVLLAQGHYAELYVRPPEPDWCYEDCLYIPECRWSLPVTGTEKKA